MKLFTALLIIACLAVSTMAKCTWTSPAGNKYDFTAKSDSEVIAPTSHLTYSFNFCGGTPSHAECASAAHGTAQSGCIYEPNKFWLVSGRWDKATNEPTMIVEKEKGSLTLAFKNGENAPTGGPARLVVELQCGKTKTASFVDGQPPTFTLNIQSPLGCPVGGVDGLSGGAIFLIVFFSVLAGYFIIGFLICKFGLKKAGVLEAIPQHAFWCALPGLYIAGIKFTVSKIAGCIGGKKGDAVAPDSSAYYGATEEDV